MTARGVPATAAGVSRLPPARALFAAFPGGCGPVRALPRPAAARLRLAFGFAAVACVVAAAGSRLRGGRPDGASARSGGPD